MKVYVLQHYWNNLRSSGFDVLGVYEGDSITRARLELNRQVAAVTASYPIDVWDSKYTYLDKDAVRLYFGDSEQFGKSTEYRWEIVERKVE